jgi:hypothetical protein
MTYAALDAHNLGVTIGALISPARRTSRNPRHL